MKKLLAILMAMVMVFALTVAVAADWSSEYADPGAGWQKIFDTRTDTGLTDAADAIGDDAVITITVSTDVSSFSWAEVQIRDADDAMWPGDEWGNYTLFSAKSNPEFTITYGELKAIVDGADAGYDIHSIKFISNTSTDDPSGLAITVTVTDPNAGADPEDGEGEGEGDDANTGDEETPAETGLALAVVPAIVAMAAVAVSKKH